MPVEVVENPADAKENVVSLVRRAETYSARLDELNEKKEGEEPYVGVPGQQ